MTTTPGSEPSAMMRKDEVGESIALDDLPAYIEGLTARAEKAESELAALRSRLERAEGDARRLNEYLVGRCEANDTHRDAIFQCELRQISGDYPTLDEWRMAIDASLAAHGSERGDG